jgi:anti-anti-sigma factor
MAEIDTPRPPPLHVEVVEDGGVPLVRLAGELDLSTAETVRSAIAPILAAEPVRLAFDLSGLKFMDSTGIAIMVHAANQVPEVEVRRPSRAIRQVIAITGLTDRFEIVE